VEVNLSKTMLPFQKSHHGISQFKVVIP